MKWLWGLIAFLNGNTFLTGVIQNPSDFDAWASASLTATLLALCLLGKEFEVGNLRGIIRTQDERLALIRKLHSSKGRAA